MASWLAFPGQSFLLRVQAPGLVLVLELPFIYPCGESFAISPECCSLRPSSPSIKPKAFQPHPFSPFRGSDRWPHPPSLTSCPPGLQDNALPGFHLAPHLPLFTAPTHACSAWGFLRVPPYPLLLLPLPLPGAQCSAPFPVRWGTHTGQAPSPGQILCLASLGSRIGKLPPPFQHAQTQLMAFATNLLCV